MPADRPALTRSTRRRLVTASATCAGAVVLLAVLVTAGWDRLVRFDETWSARAFTFTHAHGWCETLARTATWAGNGVTVTVVTAGVAVACALTRRMSLGLWLALTVAGSALVSSLLKVGLERIRPVTSGLVTSAHGFAFPSGHTRAATVTYSAVVLVVGWQVWRPDRRVRWLTAAAVTVLVAAVGWSRVLLGAHWPTDVLGGWLTGTAWVTAATALLLTRLERRSP